MPDSISYNILILGTIISISGLNNKIKMIVLGITSGLLPLFRTNYVVFSLLLIFIAFIKELYLKKFNKKIFFNMSCTLVPFLLIYFIYINIFIYPRLGVKKISSFGGRTLFSRTMVFTDCKKLSELNLNKDFSKVLINFCTNSNLNNYSVNLFSTNGLIYKTDEYLNLDRAKSDSMYLDASKKILLNNPLIILKIFKESFTDTLISSSYFFETNIYPSLGGGCEFLPTKFNSNNNDFININKLNTNNKIILVIAKLASISQKVIVAIIYLIIPTYLVYSFLKSKKKMFIEKNWEIIIIWVATITYFTITLIFTGFDHRYIQPLWLSVAWIYLLVSSSK